MADKHGGKRKGAGRKPKADEVKIIESMDAVGVPEKFWELLWKKCEKGDVQALKLWANYRFGMPRQAIDHTTGGEPIGPVTIKAILPATSKRLKQDDE